jgi:aminoglycoside phosphotransferase (APT) family kinase protein
VGRWTRQWEASKVEEMPEMDRAAAWLAANLPAEEETAIVHGDYRLGNMILHPVEPRVVAVLDWELATLGHRWRISPMPSSPTTCRRGRAG